jgi:prepilin-type N-terminal cleavage/methylation domain-containing protein
MSDGAASVPRATVRARTARGLRRGPARAERHGGRPEGGWRGPQGERAFSLIELLITAAVSSVALASAVGFFAIQAKHMRGHFFRLEAQQAMRTSLDAITRDLRLAGACLPGDGQYIALAGTNGPGPDSITVRTGLVRDNMSCIVSTTIADVAAGAASVPLASTNGFTADVLVYVRHPNGSGEIHHATGVAGQVLGLSGGLAQDYPLGAGVYAVDERTYTIDLSDPEVPRLMLTINRAEPAAFAAGMNDLQVSYVIDQNCPPCDTIDLPPDTATWRLVNDVELTATLRSVGGVQPQDEVTLVRNSRAKPRNLLP